MLSHITLPLHSAPLKWKFWVCCKINIRSIHQVMIFFWPSHVFYQIPVHIQITFTDTFWIYVAFCRCVAFVNRGQKIFNRIILRINWITFIGKFFIDIFLSHSISWTLWLAEISYSFSIHVNHLAFSQKNYYLCIWVRPSNYCLTCRRTSSEFINWHLYYNGGFFLPTTVNYVLKTSAILHLLQNVKTKMTTKYLLLRLYLLSWIENVTIKVLVQLSWWGQSERVKIPLIISTFEPRNPVCPVSRRIIKVHNCAFMSFWFLWQSVSQENTSKVFEINFFNSV